LDATGLRLPWGGAWPLPHLMVVLLQVGAFVVKVCLMIFFMMLIRWTFVRRVVCQQAHSLDVAALPLRSGDATRLARALPALDRQHRAHRPGPPRVGKPMNRETMSFRQRAYVLEVLSGLGRG